jgi:hypothetical protein
VARVKPIYNKTTGKIESQILSTGEENKKKIYEYIVNGNKGFQVHEIVAAFESMGQKITRQTVTTHLRSLVKERRLYKRNQCYFNNDPRLGNILNFARHMREASKTLFDPFQIYFSHSSKATQTNPDVYVYNEVSLSFHKSIKCILDAHSTSISPKYCKTSFQDDEMYEKYLWELANRIGAYFMYIFVEAMRPVSEYNIPGIKSDKKKELSATLMEKSLDIQMMFEKFCGYTLFDFSNQGREFSNDTFNRITTAFKKVYPVVYESLERCWSDSINTSINTQAALAMGNKGFNHNHKWEEFSIYKLKNQKYFVCRGCGFLVNEKIKNRILVKGKVGSKP